MTDPSSERVALLFLERFWSDRDAGRSVGLHEYVGLFPGHDELIAREYLSALAEARCEKEGEVGPSEEGRIGPYRLLDELGRGGQGMVWLAEDTRLGRRVALKVLTGLGPGAEMHLARFRREAALASKLDHPGICGVHDTGIEGGVPYIAMRYVEGETLSDWLSRFKSEGVAPDSVVTFDDGETLDRLRPHHSLRARWGPLGRPQPAPQTATSSLDHEDLDRLVALFEKVARALHAAHEVGIVHRDIKPGNIIITADTGEPVLLDFGLAQDDSGDAGPSLTQTGDVFGTPAYMSPEQIMGRRVRIDRRSDVYSLGVTLYEGLTMKRPFEAPTRESLYQAILSKEPERARKHNRQIPADLEVVLQCAMSKDRDKRYQTAADLAEDLRRVQAGEPVLAKKVSVLGRAWRWSKRRPAAAALVCALTIGIPAISGLGVWYWTHRDDVRAQERARREELLEDALETGFYELHEGSVAHAVAAFETAFSIDATSAEAVVGLAMARAAPNSRAALQEALGVINEGEQSVAAPGVLARTKADILTKLGRKAEAAVVMESAPKIDGPLMQFIEGTRAIDAGHSIGETRSRAQPAFLKAAEHLTRAVSGSARARRAYHFQLAHAIGHCKHAERNSALVMADALEALWSASSKAWRWIGFALRDVEPERSLSAYREAIRLDPGYADSYRKLGSGLEKQGKKEEAIAAYREAIRLDPKSARAHASLGFVLSEQGRQAEAVAEYREAIRLDPEYVWTHSALGTALGSQGKVEEAIAEHREAMRLDPTDARARSSFAGTLSNQGKLEEGITEYREAIRLDPDYALAHLNYGTALGRQGRHEEAIVEFREAIRLEVGNAVAHNALGAALGNQGKYEEAIAEFREAIRLDAGTAGAHRSLSVSLVHQGKDEEAIADFHEAIRLDREDAEAHYSLGRTLLLVGKSDDAANEFREVIRLDPKNGIARVGLGLTLVNQGKLEEGIAEYREAIRLAPTVLAHTSLGIALAARHELEQAIKEFREAVRLEPKNVLAHITLGVALAEQHKTDEAITEFREAIRLEPDDADTHRRLAAVLHERGDFTEAVAVQQKLLRLMNGADLGELKLDRVKDDLERYRDALEAATESRPSQPESRK